MYTVAYWKAELKTWDDHWRDPTLQPDQVMHLTRGLCFLAQQTLLRLGPGQDREGILSDFSERYASVRDRMGMPWMRKHAQVLASHGSDMPT